jgi:chitosanase
MELATKNIIVSVINCFETGKPQGDYGNISVYSDGKNPRTGGGFWQVTYGRSQTTEQGNLKKLLETYIANKGQFAEEIAMYMSFINEPQTDGTAWSNNRAVQALLKKMGNDPVMVTTQDAFFDAEYFQPAMTWATENGFSLPLSILVIYDSFVHSGHILDFLRERFTEMPPIKGGDEKKWIAQYLEARYKWLKTNKLAALRVSSNRVSILQNQVKQGNWGLENSLIANGQKIEGYKKIV